MDFREVVNARRSIKKYDANHKITDAELKQLFETVALSPSSSSSSSSSSDHVAPSRTRGGAATRRAQQASSGSMAGGVGGQQRATAVRRLKKEPVPEASKVNTPV